MFEKEIPYAILHTNAGFRPTATVFVLSNLATLEDSFCQLGVENA